MWATLAFERSASSRRSAEALDETAGWSAAGRSRRVGGGRAVRPPKPAQQHPAVPPRPHREQLKRPRPDSFLVRSEVEPASGATGLSG